MATRNDVAIRAGVSVATVSHVINNNKYVSPELKEKVNEAIRVLNYKPNMVARSLVTKITKHVGIIVNDITNPYYGEIAQGMEEIAHKNGYIVSLCLASGASESYLASIKQRQMDGIFMATTRNEDFKKEQFQNLVESGIAVVNGHGVGSEVNFEYKKAINNLVKYLADMGHKKIGYLSGISLDLPGNDRYLLYKEALKKNGIEFEKAWAVDGVYPYKTDNRSGYEAMNRLLKRDTRVTAVITTNDYMAFGAIKAIREAGLRIPGDISIAGCDDVFLAECVEPPLTTIRVPKKEMGRQAMYMLLSAINEKKISSFVLEADLVIRDSTGPVKGA